MQPKLIRTLVPALFLIASCGGGGSSDSDPAGAVPDPVPAPAPAPAPAPVPASAFPPPIAGDPTFSSSCAGAPAQAQVGPFTTYTGDCFVSYPISAAELAQYRANYANAAVQAKIVDAVKASFKNRIDSVVVILDLADAEQGSLPFGVNYPVQSCSVHNTACPRFARLGNVWLVARTYLKQGPSLHELLHGFFHQLTVDTNAGFLVPTQYDGHWGFSGAGGQLGGWDKTTLVSLAANNYQARAPQVPAGFQQPTSFGLVANFGNSVPYSNVELYAMGLIPETELQPVDVAVNGAFVDQANGKFSASAVRSYTAAEIKGRTLPASTPDSTRSPRAFRGLVVLATTATTVDVATVAQLNSDIEQFTVRAPTTAWQGLYNFWTATGGRASLHLATASELAGP